MLPPQGMDGRAVVHNGGGARRGSSSATTTATATATATATNIRSSQDAGSGSVASGRATNPMDWPQSPTATTGTEASSRSAGERPSTATQRAAARSANTNAIRNNSASSASSATKNIQSTIRAVTPEPPEEAPLGRDQVETAFRVFGSPTSPQTSPRSIPGGPVRRQGLVFNDTYTSSPPEIGGAQATTGGAAGGAGGGSSPPPRAAFRPRTHTMDGAMRQTSQKGVVAGALGGTGIGADNNRHRVGSFSSSGSTPMHEDVLVAAANLARHPVPSPLETHGHNVLTPTSTRVLDNNLLPTPTSTPTSMGISKEKMSKRRLIKRQSSRPTSPLVAGPPSVDSLPLPVPTDDANKVLLLMRTLCGRMRGEVEYQTDAATGGGEWYAGVSFIEEERGALMFDSGGPNAPFHITLVPDLRGCRILPVASPPDGRPCLEIVCTQPPLELLLRPIVAEEMDLWLAALLCWQQLRPGSVKLTNGPRPAVSSTAVGSQNAPQRPELRRNGSSSTSTGGGGGNSPITLNIIKVGKVMVWDKGQATSPRAVVKRPSTRDLRSPMTSWRRVSCLLQGNGELRLMTETDSTLLSVIELSQLSRCAVQRLDRTVLEEDFCIAIFPIYSSLSTQLSIFRPVYLLMESRVQYEVWYVLLRAFAVPDIYRIENGPSTGEKPMVGELEGDEKRPSKQVVDITDLNGNFHEDDTIFRLEKTIYVRATEAKVKPKSASPPGSEAAASPVVATPDRHHGRKETTYHHRNEPRDELVGNYLAEVILDGEVRARTPTQYNTKNPFWREECTFNDLPAQLPFLSIILKRVDNNFGNIESLGYQLQASLGLPKPSTGVSEVLCGSVDIALDHVERAKDHDQWLPILDERHQTVGTMLVRIRHDEHVVLLEKEYRPLSELLHRFPTGLTVQIAEAMPTSLRRLADIFLNIFQVSGSVADWLMTLVEDEIDGIGNNQQSATMSKKYHSRFGGRLRSDASSSIEPGTSAGAVASVSVSTNNTTTTSVSSTTTNTPVPHHAIPPTHPSDRETIVRDMSKSLAGEANLLFRGNSLLTHALEYHMRRLGKDYLTEVLAEKIYEINEINPNCEVDPSRLRSGEDLHQHWTRLIQLTTEVWQCVAASADRVPSELRHILKYIRAVADDRYGDFLRSVTYTSVSGFLFLRFICPAILGPKLFGLLRDHPRPQAQRTFTLIAKSLQVLANLSSFGKKEDYMEPMNRFLTHQRQSVKDYIDQVCSIPADKSTAEKNAFALPASYSTPVAILGRLTPTAREGFPSLPYLIDPARNFAALVKLWADTNPLSRRGDGESQLSDVDENLQMFNDLCIELQRRSDECLALVESGRRHRLTADGSLSSGHGQGSMSTTDEHYADYLLEQQHQAGLMEQLSISGGTSSLWMDSESHSMRPPGSSESEGPGGEHHRPRGRQARHVSGQSDVSSMSGTLRSSRNGRSTRNILSGLMRMGRSDSPDGGPGGPGGGQRVQGKWAAGT